MLESLSTREFGSRCKAIRVTDTVERDSLALGIKMNILLFLPGLLVLLFQYKGAADTVVSLGIIIVIQVSPSALNSSKRIPILHHSSYFPHPTSSSPENPPRHTSPLLLISAASSYSNGASTGAGSEKTLSCRKSLSGDCLHRM